MASWDPSYPTETVDWYGEYVARCAPLGLRWLQPPRPTRRGATVDARGVGLFGRGASARVVAPLDDDGLGLWTLDAGDLSFHGNSRRGAVCARSRPGLLTRTGCNDTSAFASSGIVDCVSVDHARQKVYVAVDRCLHEVDLDTLEVSARAPFPAMISALSTADPSLPLSVGTRDGLHFYDHRRPQHETSTGEDSTTVLDPQLSWTAPGTRLRKPSKGSPVDTTGSLLGAGPLTILHPATRVADGRSLPCSGRESEIYVAGRFPCVLVYDRRTFPRPRATIHSGARLSSLAALPYAFSSASASSLLRNVPGHTLVATGEYNGKGSLELYGFADGDAMPEKRRNRTSAGRAALLSVATQGTRILVSDGDGALRWFERDGTTPIRHWNINTNSGTGTSQRDLISQDLSNQASSRESANSEVVRKLLPVGNEPRSEVVVWTGERVGLLQYGPSRDRESWSEGENDEDEPSEEEHQYGEAMRQALARQADEVRWVQGLGLL